MIAMADNVGGAGKPLTLAAFWLAGLFPFWMGTLLAGVAGFPVSRPIALAGTLAVTALILAGVAARDAFRVQTRYPGLDLSPEAAGKLAYAALALAGLLGLVLQFGCRTGDLTLPLGGLGVLGGYFFFAPPLNWHRRSGAEAVGGLCFGLLPAAAGFYLQCGHLVAEVLVYGLVLTFGAFNMFLVQGLPLPGEAPGAGDGLAARLRPAAGALVFTLANILTIGGLVFCLLFPANPLPFRWALWLLLGLAVVNQELVKRKAYLEEARLRLLGRLTLALQVGMGLVFLSMASQRM
jgi:1,4-dihydroxy-2-naphthoate octaprenyltransferase